MADEGIEFLLELTAKLDAATAMVKGLSKIEAEALKADEALKKTEKTVGLLNRVAKSVGGSFKAVGHEIGEDFGKEFSGAVIGQFTALAGFEGLKRITEGIVDLGKEMLMTAGEAERTRASYRLLMGVEPADELLEFLDKLAKSTEFTDGELKNFAAQLIRTGFSGEKLERALAATIDLAALAPNKLAGATDALALLSKVNLKGGVSVRELVGAGLSPQGFFKRLAGELGGSIKDVQTKVEAGKVKTGVLLEALYSEIAAKTKKPLGGAGVAMSTTFLAQLEKLKDIAGNLFEDLDQSAGLKKLTAGFARVAAGLAPDSPSGSRIIKGLTAIIDHFGELVSSVDVEVWAGRIESAVTIFSTMVDFAVELGSELGRVFDGLTGFGDALGSVLYDITSSVGGIFRAAVDLGKAIWEGMQNGIVSGITYVVNAVKGLGNAVVNELKGVLGIHSPSTVFLNLGMNTSAGFSRGIEASHPEVMQTMAAAFSPRALLPPMTFDTPPLPERSVPAFFTPPVGSASGGVAGNTTTNMDASITVNIGGNSGDQSSAREQADMVIVGIRRALEATLSQLAAEGGAT